MTHERDVLIVAVSGGVDSVVMLDMLVASSRHRLVVAHVDHGIREDSGEDKAFVEQLAAGYGLEFISTELHLRSQTSEDAARQARYVWLDEVCDRYHASAVATAHHQDDVLETIIINLSRGTGWRGLCSLRETTHRHRPLLGHSKAAIIEYALAHNLEWREDSTNESLRYFRNRIRNLIIPRLRASERDQLLGLYDAQVKLRHEIDGELQSVQEHFVKAGGIERYALIMSADNVALELLRGWLGEPLEQSRFRDLLLFAKTARPGAKWSLDGQRFVLAKPRALIVSSSRD